MKRIFFVTALSVSALALAAPVSAQFARGDNDRYAYRDERTSYSQSRRVAFENGYREGLREGQRDGQRRGTFAFRDEREFQRADEGYHRSYGDRERYRQAFRTGYAEGYADGYRRMAPARDHRGGSGYRYNIAFDNGARDGYERGVEDARERRHYDVLRHRWYRSADHDYDTRYGSRQQYADQYREGFKAGYDRGYRY